MAAFQARVSALDGVRGVAALGVVWFHCGLHLGDPWMVGHGAIAVDIFFVMSGFVVVRAYGARLDAGWTIADFAAARFLRLYPLYLLGSVVGLIVAVADLGWDRSLAASGVLSLLFVCTALLVPMVGSGATQDFPLNGPSWSLLVEALLNLGFAVTARRSSPPRLLPVVGLAAGVVLTAACFGMPLLYGGSPAMLWLDLARGVFGFGCGLLISDLAQRQASLATRRCPTSLVLIGLVALLAMPRGQQDVWFDPLAILVLSPTLVFLAVSGKPTSCLGSFCRQVGALSYPLYIIHEPILDAAMHLAPRFGGIASAPTVLSVAALCCVGLAHAIGRWLEPALTRLVGRWLTRRPRPAASIGAAHRSAEAVERVG